MTQSDLNALQAELAFKRKMLGKSLDDIERREILDDITILKNDIRKAEWELSQSRIRERSQP